MSPRMKITVAIDPDELVNDLNSEETQTLLRAIVNAVPVEELGACLEAVLDEKEKGFLSWLLMPGFSEEGGS